MFSICLIDKLKIRPHVVPLLVFFSSSVLICPPLKSNIVILLSSHHDSKRSVLFGGPSKEISTELAKFHGPLSASESKVLFFKDEMRFLKWNKESGVYWRDALSAK